MFRITHFVFSPPISPKFFPILLQFHTNISTPNTQKAVYNYLIKDFQFPESRAFRISNQFSSSSLQTPQEIVKYLKSLGFTHTQIISSAKNNPQMLFTNLENTLKPKIQFLQKELALSSITLPKFISKNSSILSYSLTNRLKPTIDVVRNILRKHSGYYVSGNNNLFRVLDRCNYVITSTDYHEKLLANVSILESYGIVGNQFVNLLIRAPRFFYMSESELKRLVSRVLDLGISYGSRMFVHGLHSMSCISNDTFLKKVKLVSSFGFTENECIEMFKKFPVVIRVSEEKLRIGLDFFLGRLGMERSVLITNAQCLMYSMEDRVIARYKVLKLLESKGILKKQSSLTTVLRMSEDEFVKRYISRFPAHQKDLLFEHKGHISDSSSS